MKNEILVDLPLKFFRRSQQLFGIKYSIAYLFQYRIKFLGNEFIRNTVIKSYDVILFYLGLLLLRENKLIKYCLGPHADPDPTHNPNFSTQFS